MKKRLLFFMVLLLGICAAVPASAEEKKITLTAVCNDDGSITFTGSATADTLFVGDMVCVYKEGSEPEDGPIFFYYLSGDSEFSLTHPHLSCRATNRNGDFIDIENLTLKPGKYFAVVVASQSGKGTAFSNRAYFTVTAVAASPTAEITPEPVTPTPEVTPLPSEPRISAAPTASEKAAPTQTVPPAPDDSSQSGSDFLPIILCVVLGILFCIELAVIISVLKKKKG